MIDLWKAFWRQFGFYAEPERLTQREADAYRGQMWNDHGFYIQGSSGKAWDYMHSPEGQKARRLASIARERCELKDRLAVAIRQKKARSPIYAALRALSNEEFRLEQGK